MGRPAVRRAPFALDLYSPRLTGCEIAAAPVVANSCKLLNDSSAVGQANGAIANSVGAIYSTRIAVVVFGSSDHRSTRGIV